MTWLVFLRIKICDSSRGDLEDMVCVYWLQVSVNIDNRFVSTQC